MSVTKKFVSQKVLDRVISYSYASSIIMDKIIDKIKPAEVLQW